MLKYVVRRLDENPSNVTYGEWCCMTEFQTIEEAQAFVQRASTPNQKLIIVIEEYPK